MSYKPAPSHAQFYADSNHPHGSFMATPHHRGGPTACVFDVAWGTDARSSGALLVRTPIVLAEKGRESAENGEVGA